MIYTEHHLPAAAQEHGICLWRFAVEPHDPPHFTHVVPPDGTVNLVASIFPGEPGPRLTITGPAPRAHLVPAMHGMAASGVRLRAGAAPLLLGLPAAAMVGKMQPYLPRTAAQTAFADAMAAFTRSAEAVAPLSDAFTRLCRDVPPVDPLVMQLAERMRLRPLDVDVGAAMAEIDLSPRQLRRRFVAAAGLAPKPFAGIQRLRHACLIALTTPAANWAEVAAEAGFADQAHFNRDLARTFGTTPTRLLAYLARIRHDLVA